jgi:hypothetical protein
MLHETENEQPRQVRCNTVKVADPEQLRREDHRFKPGNQIGKGHGRPKGSRATLSEAFLADVQMHWLANGKGVIDRVAEADPSTYLRVVASILPKELNVTVSVLDTMSDDDLLTLLQGLRERRRQQQAKVIEGSVSARQDLLSGTEDGQASRKP